MIKVQISGIEQELSSLSPSWIHDQILGRQRDGIGVCVRVFIQTPFIDLVLSSGECARGQGGSRQPNLDEKRIIDLWGKMELNDVPINGGKLVGFLMQVKDLDR